ncbi:MAG: transposase family protein [Bacteroidetes bacterium]|nr:transposase family protein [Bacteroidota bacterium]
MSKCFQLKQSPDVFRRLTGVTVEKFYEIYHQLTPLYEAYEKKRLSRSDRQRAVGGGNKFKLELEDRLLMLLMYYRLYVTHVLLGFIFDINDSNVGRNINPLQPLLAKIFRIPERKVNLSPEEILTLFIDATEQTINRPSRGQKNWYSGKKKKHTIKHQVIVSKTGRIKAVGNAAPGRHHDKKDYQQKKFVIHPSITKKGDSGYQGTDLEVPFKKAKKQKLTREQKAFNRQHSRERIVVEHVIGKLKIFKILAERFRNPRNSHNLIFKNIAGIHNVMFA